MSLQMNPMLRQLSHRVSFAALREGDHIYTINGYGTFTHHGIVVTQGPDARTTYVVEFNVPRDDTLPQVVTADLLLRPEAILAMIGAARVQRVSLEAFTGGGTTVPDEDDDDSPLPAAAAARIRLVRYDSPVALRWMARAGANRTAPCFPAERTVALANEFLRSGAWPPYELFLNNCEHFAVYCKTGIAHSAQAERIPARARTDVQRRLDRIVRKAARHERRVRGFLPRLRPFLLLREKKSRNRIPVAGASDADTDTIRYPRMGYVGTR
jgi:hypothetical protein